jgi:hypothetical protein
MSDEFASVVARRAEAWELVDRYLVELDPGLLARAAELDGGPEIRQAIEDALAYGQVEKEGAPEREVAAPAAIVVVPTTTTPGAAKAAMPLGATSSPSGTPGAKQADAPVEPGVGVPLAASVAPPPRAEWRAEQAAKAAPVVDLAAVLDEARKRADSVSEATKKISAAIPPDVGPKAEIKPAGVELVALLKASAKRSEEEEAAHRRVYSVPAVVAPEEVKLGQMEDGSRLVALLNKKHAVVGNYGGRCVVLSWERWGVDRKVIVPDFQGFEDIKKRYGHIKVADSDERAGEYWLQHPGRLQYEGVVFEPGGEPMLPGRLRNLWQGFAVVPQAGRWPLMQAHIGGVLANGDQRAAEYIVRWLAWTLQHPGEVAEVALVFKGDEGVGKGRLTNAMMRLFGPHALTIANPKLLTGDFSGHLQWCSFLVLEEAFWDDRLGGEGVMRHLITDPLISIHPKGFKPFSARNCLHCIMNGNADWVVPTSHSARRYAVFEVSGARRDDRAYFDALNVELDGGGLAAMAWDLLGMDLGEWHPRLLYETAALTDQKQESLRGLDAWVEGLLQDGVLPGSVEGYPDRALSGDLLRSAREVVRDTNNSRIVKKLRKLGMLVEGREGEYNVKVARGRISRPLAECRAAWEARYRGRWAWHAPLAQWEAEKER